MEKITWGTGITRIELDAHCCQTFLHKISAPRALTFEGTKAVQTDMVKTLLNVAKIQVPIYKKSLRKIMSISKLRIILSTKIIFTFFIKQCNY